MILAHTYICGSLLFTFFNKGIKYTYFSGFFFFVLFLFLETLSLHTDLPYSLI